MKTAAYIGNFGFPDHNASGKRVLGNCKLLQRLGYKVICIMPGTLQTFEYEGIQTYSINTGNEIERVLHNQIGQVESILDSENVELVFLYGALYTQKENLRLMKWCHRKHIKVFYDQVDWLDINWHNPMRGMIRARNYRILNQKVIPLCDGVICISSYLKNIHSKNGKKTVVIPPLSTKKQDVLPKEYKADERIRLIYAGTTSDKNRPTSQWKDRIDIMFEKLRDCMKVPSLYPFVLDVYGMTQEQYIGMFPNREQSAGRQVIEELGERVVFHGTTPNEEVVKRVKMADFTVLIRDKKRVTMAGFPTKVSESISCGTPILSNDTSDIKKYVEHGICGYVIDDVDQLFTLALSATADMIIEMKRACQKNPFYYENFLPEMKTFLEG